MINPYTNPFSGGSMSLDEVIGIGNVLIQSAVETVLSSIKGSLKKKEDVTIAGFGTFKVKVTKPRMGRNPKTGEQIQIPSKKKVAFKASKDLKESL